MKASIIIRTRNEERWIGACLESVFQQSYDDYEVILVDNNSQDGTVAKATKYDVKLITIDNFRPGLAINQGVRASDGDVIVCLSGHCIPVNQQWLAKLAAPLSNPQVAGVYGRQQPMSFTTDRDKRDLLTVFGLDAKVQRKDPFFHNANSAIRRDTWSQTPFDEETPHIEDRLWAHRVLAMGMEIHYEPEASVYHFHGIHQDDNPQRRRNVVQILENLASGEQNLPAHHAAHPAAPSPDDLNTIALIPTRGEPIYLGDKPLLSYTIAQAKNSQFINKVVVLTDNQETANIAKDNGAYVPFLRPPELSREFVAVSEVLKFGVEELEHWDISPDLCVVLEETYPFRPQGLADDLIVRLLREGTDSVIAVKPERRSIWRESESGLEVLSPAMPSKLKSEGFFVSLFGLGFVTYTAHIRDGSMGISQSHPYAIDDPIATIEVRDAKQRECIKNLLPQLI